MCGVNGYEFIESRSREIETFRVALEDHKFAKIKSNFSGEIGRIFLVVLWLLWVRAMTNSPKIKFFAQLRSTEPHTSILATESANHTKISREIKSFKNVCCELARRLKDRFGHFQFCIVCQTRQQIFDGTFSVYLRLAFVCKLFEAVTAWSFHLILIGFAEPLYGTTRQIKNLHRQISNI